MFNKKHPSSLGRFLLNCAHKSIKETAYRDKAARWRWIWDPTWAGAVPPV